MMVNVYAIVYILAVVGNACQMAPASVSGRERIISFDGTYKLVETVLMHDNSKDPVGYQITGNLEIRRLHPALLMLKINDIKLHIMSRKSPTPHGFIAHSSHLDSALNNPFLIHLINGKIDYIYVDPTENMYLRNFKRGISSLFQFQNKDTKIDELDTSGKCAASYIVNLDNILKEKSDCQTAESMSIGEDKLWGGKLQSRMQTLIKLSSDHDKLESIIAEESHILKENIADFAETKVSTEIDIIFEEFGKMEQQYGDNEESIINEIGTDLGIQYEKFELFPENEEPNCKDQGCPTLSKVVQENKKHLQTKDIGTSKSALAFIRILEAVKKATTEELYSVIDSKENKKILPQLMDIWGAAQTEEAHQAALKKLKINADYNLDMCERYLWALSMSPEPNETIVKDMIQIANSKHKDPKLWQTLVLTLTSMTKHIAQANSDRGPKLVEQVTKIIVNKLQECKEDESCRQIYLKALANLGSAAALPVLLNFAVNSTRKSGVTAFHAISRLGVQDIDKHVLKVAEKVFLTNGEYDSSARTIALDLILESKPSDRLIARLLSVLKYKETPKELKEYLLQRLNMISMMDADFYKCANDVLHSEGLYHYNTLAQGGLSTAFSRNFMKGGSLSTMQEVSKGILKRGNVHVNLHYNNVTHTLFTLGIFSTGLNSFVSDEGDDDTQEEESASAGLELTVLDVGLRPFVFFDGSGELMSHVWAGTASTKTPAYQALLLLGQKKIKLPLGIGVLSDIMLSSSASVELAGQIEISLWNRNAESLVQNSAGLAVESTIRIDTSLVKTQVQSNLMVEPRLDLSSNIEFSGEIALCLQLQQPNTAVRYNTFKVERIPGSKHKLRKTRYKTILVPGKTYALNLKNSEMCNVIFKDS